MLRTRRTDLLGTDGRTSVPYRQRTTVETGEIRPSATGNYTEYGRGRVWQCPGLGSGLGLGDFFRDLIVGKYIYIVYFGASSE